MGSAAAPRYCPRMANVVVTGASTGIGRATAAHLVSRGHQVFAGVRSPEDAESLASEVGAGLVPLLVDVTDGDQVSAAAREVDERAPEGLHGLVNNAGIAVGGPLEHLPIEDVRRQLEVNVVAQVAVTQAFLPAIRRTTGRIAFVGSLSGRVGLPMIGPYAASKHALEGLTESWRAELAPWGIRVALIEPGSIKTEIWSKSRDQADELAARLAPEVLDQYQAHVAMVRSVVEAQDKIGIPAVKVARTVERALFSSRWRPRYQVGLDSRATAVVSRVLPDRAKAATIGLASGARLPRA
jgi:NAD(P)-dependent dehydrogenase (short-subunit alcohol dehydrogenase family)